MIIVGAGISGLSAAVHFADQCANKTFAILEARDVIGGTWDLFRYPGIRSDSDMQTFGFKFKPWTDTNAIASAPRILNYLNETADEYNLRDKIRFNHKVLKANWVSADGVWQVFVNTPDGETVITTRFLFMCAGYYSYDDPHNPDIQGEENFRGKILHPQNWDETLDYKGKHVVVIGSGATAVTLIPAMAPDTAHITMLQRSPSYIASRPAKDVVANVLMKLLPNRLAYKIAREKNIWIANYLYKSSMKNPNKMKKFLFKRAKKALGLNKTDTLPDHYIPRYNPWEQRLCLIPDDDMFKVLRDGKASIVTHTIEGITETGIKLTSGDHLDCDIIIKSTGINVDIVSKLNLYLDETPVNMADTFTYEGFMFSDVPNLASTFGYINASWTLRADLISDYVCRLIKFMDDQNIRVATPRAPKGMKARPWITTFNPGYITRILDTLPKQGDAAPWINAQDYIRDRKVLPHKRIDDGHMEFSNPDHILSQAAE